MTFEAFVDSFQLVHRLLLGRANTGKVCQMMKIYVMDY
jgi:hypothetical protein